MTPREYTEGYEAFESGAPCQYAEGTSEYDYWMLGRATAEQDWTAEQNSKR